VKALVEGPFGYDADVGEQKFTHFIEGQQGV
jgi:hypothetical protein